MSLQVEAIGWSDYKQEPCPKDACSYHQVAQLHSLTINGVEHIGYAICCGGITKPSWLAWSPSIAFWDQYYCQLWSVRRD